MTFLLFHKHTSRRIHRLLTPVDCASHTDPYSRDTGLPETNRDVLYTAVHYSSQLPLFTPAKAFYTIPYFHSGLPKTKGIGSPITAFSSQFNLWKNNVQPFLVCEPSAFFIGSFPTSTMTSADFLVYRNTEPNPRPPSVR